MRDFAAERKRFVKQQAEYKGFLTDRKDCEMTSTIERAAHMVKILDEEIASVEEEMLQIINSDPSILRNYELLNSIKGIGTINAMNTIIHTNNFQAFETARQYACYLGIAPFEHSSGTKLLKADLSQAANSAIVWDKEMKEYYERKRKEGKAYGVVLNAVKFKLVGRMFAVVKRGTPFVELMTYKK